MKRLTLLLPLLLLTACLEWPDKPLNPDAASEDSKVGKDGSKPDRKRDRALGDQIKTDKPADLPIADKPVKPADLPIADNPIKPADLPIADKPQKPADLPIADKPQKPADLKFVLLADGKACSTDDQCHSGHCTDGVCCDQACKGSCHTCKAPLTGGQCVPVAYGDKPPAGKQCAITVAGLCGEDGTCDGAGGCKFKSGNSCNKAKCGGSKNSIVLGSSCNGMGSCVDLGSQASPLDCKTYACDASTKSCYWSCTISDAKKTCEQGKACSGGKCDGKDWPMGTTCSSGGQCESGKCVDGVCCDSDCKEPCKTCALEGARGRCVGVPLGHKPIALKGSCPVQTCRDGRCDGTGKCRVSPAGASCGATTCILDKNGYQLRTMLCDAKGSCAESLSSCGNYICQPGNTSCFGRCTDKNQCVATKNCNTAHHCI